MKFFSRLLLICSLFISIGSWADALGLDSVDGNDEDFLPVEQAYQASVSLNQESLTVEWVIAPDYYLYKDKFKLSAQTGNDTQTLEGQYDKGLIKFDEYYDKDVESFYTTTQIRVPLNGLPEQFELKMRSQGCADAGLCYPPRTQYFQIDTLQATAVETQKSSQNKKTAAANQAANSPSPSPSEQGLGKSLFAYLLFAIGGGLLLNLMPCVFPVLSLKALTFASSSGSEHRHHMHGWAYTLGVIGSFVVVALLIFAAKAAGQQTGWGFQLQSPEFVAIMTYLFFVMGLSLSGMIHFGTSLMGIGHGLTAKEGLRGSFFTGILAAVVASPCTGPLMAPALGFALTQPLLISLSVFIALGFGMALPFLLLSYSPKLAAMLPKPGLWMEKLKQLLAFPMYLTAAWLLFVFGRQVGMTGLFYLVIGAIAIVFAIWLFQHQPKGHGLRWTVRICGSAAIVFALYTAISSEKFRNRDDVWQEYSRALVTQLRNQGQPVFVDFTADWCITCKANKALALSRANFLQAVKDNNVALLKADWTNEDPVISEVLREFNRSGVPLYLVYPADTREDPEVLPQLLTQDMVIEAIKRATGR